MTLKPIGQYWEQRAEHFLLQNGLQLIARNFSTSSGEIDLIMRDGSMSLSSKCDTAVAIVLAAPSTV